MRPIVYRVNANCTLEDRDPSNRSDSKASWAIVSGGLVMNRDFGFEYEPLPSSRDDEFVKRCRFTYTEACALLYELSKAGKILRDGAE